MDILIPSVGESVVEALLAVWKKQDGDLVQKDEPLCELETDKITIDLAAEVSGVLRIMVQAGATLPVGSLIGRIDESAVAKPEAPGNVTAYKAEQQTSPAVRMALREKGLDPSTVKGSGPGGRLLMEDLEADASVAEAPVQPWPSEIIESGRVAVAVADSAGEKRVRMSPLRKRIAERLLQARQQTAMLTTFNEADMSALMQSRADAKGRGRAFGILPGFIKAVCDAAAEFPAVNARIEGEDIVYHNYLNVGIAMAAEKGLVVPVIRNAELLSVAQLDLAIAGFVEKIKTNRLEIADLEGGTFTISNGGTFGSLLSTPILNPPQSAVLGMHAIQERPVAREGQVVIRPMMYLALSYDHRIIDGREAVGFLKFVKDRVEDSGWLEGLLA